jgi:signal transduction histidine kinase
VEELSETSNSFEVAKPELSRDEMCYLMQQIGLPALWIEAGTMEVVAFNDLFADLAASTKIRDTRLWFVEAVMPTMNDDEKTEWAAAAAGLKPASLLVRFTSMDGRKTELEMRSAGAIRRSEAGQLILCVFVPSSAAFTRKKFEAGVAQGKAMERSRIRNELHQNVSQKLLGAAFGCKLLAGKVAEVNQGLGQTASDLAELLNGAVVDLQNLTRGEQDFN